MLGVGFRDTCKRRGFGAAMAQFIALVRLAGPFPAGYGERSRTCRGRPGHGYTALRAAQTRIVIGIVIGIGEEFSEMVPVMFVGGHDGVLGGEFGRAGKPDAFAAVLRGDLD